MLDLEKYFNKKREQEGDTFLMFNSTDKKISKHILEILFNFIYCAIDIYPNLNQNKIVAHFMDTLSNLYTLRVDLTDIKKNYFINRLSSSVARRTNRPKETCKSVIKEYLAGKTDFDDDKKEILQAIKHYTENHFTHEIDKDGKVNILCPTYLDNQKSSNQKEKNNADKALCHEFLHAMSAWTNAKGRRITGISTHPTINNLYEGLNEYYTLKIFKKMCPDEIVSVDYPSSTVIVGKFLSSLLDEDKSAFFEDYITGNALDFVKRLSCYKNKENSTILEYITKKYNTEIDAKKYKDNKELREEFISHIADFEKVQEFSKGSKTNLENQKENIYLEI